MTDYFDQLESALRAAVPLIAVDPARPAVARRPHRPRWGALVAALAAAVAVAILVGAVALLGHRHAPTQPSHGNPPARHSRIQGDQYALGSWPSLDGLKANFAILRGPVTAQDRSWKPECDCAGTMRQLPLMTRHAQTLPDGTRMFVDVTQTLLDGDMGLPSGTYVLDLDIVNRHGAVDSSSFGPNVGYTVRPLQDRTGRPGAQPKAVNSVWAGLVPDGVAAVRWTFACDGPSAKGAPPCQVAHARTFTVPVIDNVAARRVAQAGLCAGCPGPTGIAWYDSSGRLVWRYRGGSNLPGPPFVKGGHGSGRLAVLRGDGVAGAILGRPTRQATRALIAALGPAAVSDVAVADCGIDHESAWTSPQVATPLTIYLRGGRFVGYRYGAPRSGIGLVPGPGAVLTTAQGLTVADTVGEARRLYGSRLSTNPVHNGTWAVSGAGGTLTGELQPVTYPMRKVTVFNPISTVAAGETGCVDTTP